MNKIIFTGEFCQPENLQPFTLTRQIQDIRIGIFSIREKWEKMMDMPSFDKKEEDYKDPRLAVNVDEVIGDDICYIIHSNVLPTPGMVKAILRLKDGQFLAAKDGAGIAFRITRKDIIEKFKIRVGQAVPFEQPVMQVRSPWDIVQLNDWAIRQDFSWITRKRKSQALPKSNKLIRPSAIFAEKGAIVEHAIINASAGPVYIGKNAMIMEGCLIRGPVAMGEAACLKMGARIYGATTLGPACVAGGEIKNSVFFGYSNKAHDGYLGDSVVGEWCNLGAGTSCSNLKNNAAEVRVWTPGGEQSAGLKCGMMMGDYCKTAVNTSVNTGTVIGACCNVFGAGLTPKYIPSFSWGSDGVQRYEFEKAMRDISNWKKLKGQLLTGEEEKILRYVYDRF